MKENVIKLHDKKFKVMIPAAKIEEAVAAVAAKINEDYREKRNPLFLGVLNGSFMFMSDLLKKIDFNCEISFVKLSSYCGTSSSGDVKCLIGPVSYTHLGGRVRCGAEEQTFDRAGGDCYGPPDGGSEKSARPFRNAGGCLVGGCGR